MTARTYDRVEPDPAPPGRDGRFDEGSGPEPGIRRGHLVALVAIGLVGLLRGLFWVGATEVWNPTDEAHHYAFVASLAEGDGIPTVGKDVVPVEVIEVEKASPTLPFRALPHAPVLDDPYWVIEGSQYEGVQPPLYYILLVPFYWLSKPFGFVASIYGLRIGSVLFALAAVPLAWLLARELFPRRPAVWLAAPAVLVAINGFNSNLASITNDALVVPLAAAAIYAAARLYRTPTLKWAALTGVGLGAALLAKTSAIGLVPLLALPYFWLLVTRRRAVLGVVTAGAVTAGCAGLVLLPWVAWNLATYGSPTAAAASNAITGQFMEQTGLSPGIVRAHARLINTNFWDLGLMSHIHGPPYERLFLWTVIVAVVVGLVAAFVRRDGRAVVAVAWTGVALPLAFVGMESITFGVFNGVGQPQGRHLYIALVPLAVLVAGAAVVAIGPRWGLVAVAFVIALAFVAEEAQVHDYVTGAYGSGRIASSAPEDEPLAPVVDQSLNEGFKAITTVEVDPPCPVRAVALLVDGNVPPALTIGGTATPLAGTVAQLSARSRHADSATQVYPLASPLAGPFEVVAAEPFLVGTSLADATPHLALPDGPGDPMVRLYCQVPDSERVRFEQQFPPQHPGWMSYSAVRLWPRLWAGLGILGLVAAIGAALRWPRARSQPTVDWSGR